MKRSEINKIIKRFEKAAKENGFNLPPFCGWTPEDWESKNHEYDEIRDNMLGWDVTDYGMGDYDNLGLALITIRNGNTKMDKYTKTYAEKLVYVEGKQVSPMHFHWEKMEDIINRGGSKAIFTLYNATKDDQMDKESDVMISRDGRNYKVKAGEPVVLAPGESISLYPYTYHEFCLEDGADYALMGEVSMCNDDNVDNKFYKPLGRFPKIEEDEAPYRLLCNEYPKAK